MSGLIVFAVDEVKQFKATALIFDTTRDKRGQ
jgi:hypothetical protein